MKNILLLCALIFFGSITVHAQEEVHTITVNFTGMKSDKGSVYVALYKGKDSFLKKPYKGDIVNITDKKATVIFKDISTGVYAVSAFHDKNDNKKMDTNFIGIPKEPTGMSNDAKGFMGPPKYKDAKFSLTEDVILAVKIK